jgi:anaerobic ribonucleoside-triphosphate reductase activating protein
LVGCGHYCLGCSNLQLIEPTKDSIKLTVDDFILQLKDYSTRLRTNNISFLGGDPLYKDNLDFMNALIKEIKEQYNICIYTGYNINYVINFVEGGFKFVKCGKYDIDLKQVSEKKDTYIKLASTNQNFYDANYKQISDKGVLYFER